MITIYSEAHRLQDGKAELCDGELVPCFETPKRADLVLAQVKRLGLGPVLAPDDHGLEPIVKVHAADFVAFLQCAWDDWRALGRTHDALPLNWVAAGMRRKRPDHIDGQLGYYSFDAGSPITAGTWRAALSSANSALTGAAHIARGERGAFALCRPPGHHAGRAYFGGYCFLNNAAIAAQALRDAGFALVAVIDVDYHHGNGTQDIFYNRGDVFFASLHGDPAQEYPYFLGYADETGEGAGDGANANFPLPWGTGWDRYEESLQAALARFRSFGADALVVSLGVDTFKDDPISRFQLGHDDFLRLGERLASLGLPTLFVMEGGYAVEAIGVNVVNVLKGFEGG